MSATIANNIRQHALSIFASDLLSNMNTMNSDIYCKLDCLCRVINYRLICRISNMLYCIVSYRIASHHTVYILIIWFLVPRADRNRRKSSKNRICNVEAYVFSRYEASKSIHLHLISWYLCTYLFVNIAKM